MQLLRLKYIPILNWKSYIQSNAKDSENGWTLLFASFRHSLFLQ